MKRLESLYMLTICLCIFILFLLADLMRLDTRVYTNERPFIIRSLYTSYRDARTYIEYIVSFNQNEMKCT